MKNYVISLTKDLRVFFEIVSNLIYILRIKRASKFAMNRYLGEVIRETHSIEKGLSLEHVRMGFGLAKFMESDQVIQVYKEKGGNMNAEPMRMYLDALNAYLEFHKKNNFSNKVVERVRNNYQVLCREIKYSDGSLGGITRINRRFYTTEEQDIISSIFKNRHSVREFEQTPVDMNNLKSAIELAMHCPSACNRQCQRLYIVEKKDFSKLENSFDGIGGFADDLDKILFITGSMSVYRDYEMFQWIVTGSIFAAYLSLSLEIFSIGCCFIQRPVLPNKKWKMVSKKIGVPEDEQLICCMGIGNLKHSYNVPISHRLDYDSMVSIVSIND